MLKNVHNKIKYNAVIVNSFFKNKKWNCTSKVNVKKVQEKKLNVIFVNYQ